MAEVDIKTLGKRFYEAFNARDIATAEELFAPNFISHAMGTVGGMRRALMSLFAKYPDIHVIIEDQLVEGDRIALRMTVQGLPRVPGRPEPVMMEFFRIENGRVVEVWGAGNDMVARP